MLTQLKYTFMIASSNPQFKVAIKILFLALALIAALIQPDGVLANPSWGDMGG